MSSRVRITSVISSDSKARISSHSHIKGLGLNDKGEAKRCKDGFIGQKEARWACGVFVHMLKQKTLAGKALLLVGEPGCGKTALAIGLSKELGPRVPFCHMTGSEVYSSEVKKTEILMEHFRRSIGVRIKEVKEVYEGVVMKIEPLESDDHLGGYGKTVTSVHVELRTQKGSRTLNLDPHIYESLQKEKVTIGDVIYIEANNGNVRRVGRSDEYISEHCLESEQYVPVPKGDVHKKKNVVQDVTLHDLDIANSKPSGSSDGDLFSIINSIVRPKKTEISAKLRKEINKIVDKYIRQGIAELIPGVLFIDEVHMLDIECFTFLNHALESSLSPIVVLATNRGTCKVKGTEVKSPHGIPVDLMDRLTILRTQRYTAKEIAQIIAIRAEIEGIQFENNAKENPLTLLAKIGFSKTLRYALQLMMPAKEVAAGKGRDYITANDIRTVKELYADVGGSVNFLNKEGFIMQ